MCFLAGGMLVLAEMTRPSDRNLPSLRPVPKPSQARGLKSRIESHLRHLYEWGAGTPSAIWPLNKTAIPGLYETSVEQRRAKRDTAMLYVNRGSSLPPRGESEDLSGILLLHWFENL